MQKHQQRSLVAGGRIVATLSSYWRWILCCICLLNLFAPRVLATATTSVSQPALPPRALTSTNLSASTHVAALSPAHANWYVPQRMLEWGPNQRSIAKALGWTPSQQGAYRMCGGFYRQPWRVQHLPLLSTQEANKQRIPIHITSRGKTTLLNDGRTILRRDVVAVQQGRITQADQAILYRDQKSGRLQQIKLRGHVRYQERDRELLGGSATLDLVKDTLKVQHALYHLQSMNPDGSLYNIWGSAEHLTRLADGVLLLRHATYSSCGPLNNVWRLSAQRMRLDKKAGSGVAHQVVLRAKQVPVMYTPYLKFPIDRKRKTGFLWPTFSHILSKHHGTDITLPFYWNIAPNYDLLWNTRIMTRRGVELSPLWRYLTRGQQHQGQFSAQVLPWDRGFTAERNALLQYPSVQNNPVNSEEIRKLHNTRYQLQYQDDGAWGKDKRWYSHVRGNYVSDPYFLQDFSNTQGPSDQAVNNQLFNQAQLGYDGDAWQGAIDASGYQTLQPVNQPQPNLQYWRLPEVNAMGYMPRRLWHRLDFQANMQLVNFVMPYSRMQLANNQIATPVGVRLHNRPGLLLPLSHRGFSITPQFWLDTVMTSYRAAAYNQQLSPAGLPVDHRQQTVARSIPIAAVDMRSYLERGFSLGNLHLTQTIEPELFYLYVPYRNQQRMPVFDTQLQSFSYDRLFALNQFTGNDRLQNANQFSLGLQLRTLNNADGHPILTIGNGVIWYLQDRRVPLSETQNALTPAQIYQQTQTFSPWVSNISFSPAQYITLNGSSSWDLQQHELQNASAGINLMLNPADQLSAGYTYVLDGAYNLAGQLVDLHQANAGLNLGLGPHLKLLASGNYNFVLHYPITSLAGVEYDSCCWAWRLMFSHNFKYMTVQNTPYMENRIYVQLAFTGLGGMGNRDPGGLLQTLPGYEDRFHPTGSHSAA